MVDSGIPGTDEEFPRDPFRVVLCRGVISRWNANDAREVSVLSPRWLAPGVVGLLGASSSLGPKLPFFFFLPHTITAD